MGHGRLLSGVGRLADRKRALVSPVFILAAIPKFVIGNAGYSPKEKRATLRSLVWGISDPDHHPNG